MAAACCTMAPDTLPDIRRLVVSSAALRRRTVLEDTLSEDVAATHTHALPGLWRAPAPQLQNAVIGLDLDQVAGQALTHIATQLGWGSCQDISHCSRYTDCLLPSVGAFGYVADEL